MRRRQRQLIQSVSQINQPCPWLIASTMSMHMHAHGVVVFVSRTCFFDSSTIQSCLQRNKHMLAILVICIIPLGHWLGLLALPTSSRRLSPVNQCICHLGSDSQRSWEMETGLCESHYTPSSQHSSLLLSLHFTTTLTLLFLPCRCITSS